MGDAVADLVVARMDMLRATFRARAAFLRAQAQATDSVTLRQTLKDRADEAEYLLGQVGG